MTIRELLAKAGISEAAYAGLSRQGVISFMRKRRKGHSTFQREHLLALKAFELLRLHGVRSHTAGDVVGAAFPTICKFVQSGGNKSCSVGFQFGVQLVSIRGKALAMPLTDPVPRGAEILGRVEVDLRGLDVLVPPDQPELDRLSQAAEINPGRNGKSD